MQNMIYLDNAATTNRKPDEVIQAVCSALTSFGNSGRGAHDASLDASRVIYDTRVKLAALFGVRRPQSIAFTLNSTESLNIAVNGLLSPEDHVITTELEHNSVLRPLYRLEQQGLQTDYLKSDLKGNICIPDMIPLIKDNTKAVICTHASNLTGNIVDIGQIGAICRKYGILFIVDASQTAGVHPIDVEEMNIDVLCFTGHKGLMGPQGTGGIYVREGLVPVPLKVGGSGVMTFEKEHPAVMPTMLEAGTMNGHGIAGLHAALEFIEKTGTEAIEAKEQKLMRQFYDGIKDLPDIKIYGDFDAKVRAPIVTINIGDYDSAEVSDELFERFQISTRPGGHCAPLMHHAFGTVEQGAVRFSFSFFNTEEEVETAVLAVKKLIYD